MNLIYNTSFTFNIQGNTMDLFLGQIFVAGRFRVSNMSLKEKCCWEIDNSGCLRGFGRVESRIAGMCYSPGTSSPRDYGRF